MHGQSYPKTVKQMLIKRSAPQPATANTPTGGTEAGEHAPLAVPISVLTDDGNEHQKQRTDKTHLCGS